MNAIADTVQGKEYDSPPYTVVATYEDGSNSVSIQIHYKIGHSGLKMLKKKIIQPLFLSKKNLKDADM